MECGVRDAPCGLLHVHARIPELPGLHPFFMPIPHDIMIFKLVMILHWSHSVIPLAINNP